MWNVVSIVAAVVVIILLFEFLYIAEKLKNHLFDRVPRKDIEERVTQLEKQVEELNQKIS